MRKRKKVCLLIVEGVSDETAIAIPLDALFKDNPRIKVHVIHGDLTTQPGMAPDNIVRKLGNIVKNYLNVSHLNKTDICMVIQIVDTDGAFIPNSSIQQAPIDLDDNMLPRYEESCILARNVEKIIERNTKKQENLRRIYVLPTVCGGIPFKVYYFSCNLDHVIHGDANTVDSKKVNLADKFAEMYQEEPEKFREFLQEKFPVPCVQEYLPSWTFIEEGVHSLECWSNFSLALEEIEHQSEILNDEK